MSDPVPLLLVGAGGFGREVAALVEDLNHQAPTWNLCGFVDDNTALHDTTVMGIPVRGSVDWLVRQTDFSVSPTIGNGAARRSVADRLATADLQPATLVHPAVSVHRTVTLGPGAILCQGAAPTVDVQIGPYTVLDQHCTVGHDAVLDAFVSLRPGARVSGSAHLKQEVTVGAGAVVLPNVTVGAGTTVGAGAVVTNDLPPNCTAVGRPARPQ